MKTKQKHKPDREQLAMKMKPYIKLFLTFFTFSLLFVSCAEKGGKVKLIILPDTQTYVEKYPEIFKSQKRQQGISNVGQLSAKSERFCQRGEWVPKDSNIGYGKKSIKVQTYSPWLKKYKTESDQDFEFINV